MSFNPTMVAVRIAEPSPVVKENAWISCMMSWHAAPVITPAPLEIPVTKANASHPRVPRAKTDAETVSVVATHAPIFLPIPSIVARAITPVLQKASVIKANAASHAPATKTNYVMKTVPVFRPVVASSAKIMRFVVRMHASRRMTKTTVAHAETHATAIRPSARMELVPAIVIP